MCEYSGNSAFGRMQLMLTLSPCLLLKPAVRACRSPKPTNLEFESSLFLLCVALGLSNSSFGTNPPLKANQPHWPYAAKFHESHIHRGGAWENGPSLLLAMIKTKSLSGAIGPNKQSWENVENFLCPFSFKSRQEMPQKTDEASLSLSPFIGILVVSTWPSRGTDTPPLAS